MGKAERNERIREVIRDSDVAGDEPVVSVESQKVCGMGYNGDTPYISPTQDGVAPTGIEIGDEVTVDCYHDRIVIRPE